VSRAHLRRDFFLQDYRMTGWSYGRVGFALAVLGAAAACVEPRVSQSQASAATPPAACRATILVTFDHEPTSDFLTVLAAASATDLSSANRLLPTLYSFAFAADDDDCNAPLARLRAQAGVRSVELDARRRPNQATNG
jgi:hypothetical protein